MLHLWFFYIFGSALIIYGVILILRPHGRFARMYSPDNPWLNLTWNRWMTTPTGVLVSGVIAIVFGIWFCVFPLFAK
jgi:uncharacterized membrane protein HdeD (DUF308 family)